MKNRRVILSLAALIAMFGAAMIALAERPAKVIRVGFLSHIAAKDSSSITNFLHGMRERGYVEGKNLMVGRPKGSSSAFRPSRQNSCSSNRT